MAPSSPFSDADPPILPLSRPANKDPIFAWYNANLELFRRLVVATDDHASSEVWLLDLPNDVIRDDFTRLRQWGTRTGAMIEPNARRSLDQWLRRDMSAAEKVKAQLEVLWYALEGGVYGGSPSSQIILVACGCSVASFYLH